MDNDTPRNPYIDEEISDRVLNPYLPFVRRLRDEAVAEQAVTATALWDAAWATPQAMMKMLDVHAAMRALLRNAIHTAVGEYGPAYRTAEGWEHIDAEADVSAAVLEQVVAAAHQRTADYAEAEKALEEQLLAARLRETGGEGLLTRESELAEQ